MQSKQNVSAGRRTYNQFVANEMMEDFALRFTAKRARKWSYSRIASTALGIVSFMVLEAIGGAITLNYGFINAAWAIGALVAVIFISGLPISYYAARYGVDIDLLSRGAGFGYIGSTIASLVYASFTFIFFALEAAIMSMALELLLGIPLYLAYAVSALVVLPLVTHGITYISRFQVWSQPVWVVLQLIPLLYVFNHPHSSLSGWLQFTGDAGPQGGEFNLLLFGAASAVLLSLVAQIGEQVDFLRFLPPKPKSGRQGKWWAALALAGPGWILFGAAKLLLGSFLAFLALKQGIDREVASDPAHMYQVAFDFVFNDTSLSILIAAVFVILSQLKINVANAYAGSLAWSNFFSRVTHHHPGRVVWMVFNVLIALLLMELGIYQTLESMLQVYSVLVLAWLSSVVADLIINKPLGISPSFIEFKRARLYDINPVGTVSMLVASIAGFVAHMGWLGETTQALGSYVAFFVPFITVPLIGWLTRGKYYLVDPNQPKPATHEQTCCICQNQFDGEDMTFCPAYGQTICSLCCSLDVRCGDQCREHATLSAQVRELLRRYLSEKFHNWLTTPIVQSGALTLMLSGLSGGILWLIYWQLSRQQGEVHTLLAASLVKFFFFLLIIIGVVSWIFTLIRISNRSALNELRLQTRALADEVAAHEKTSQAYQLARDAAESANQAKSRYLAGLSHELRTPLNVLLGYAQLLSQDRKLANQTRDAVTIMKRNGEHLADLIEGVLEFSKIEAGRLYVHRDEVQLQPLLDQLADMFQQQAQIKGLEFDYILPPGLPDFVAVDKQRFRQILINLIANAVKFTEHGRVTFQVIYRNEVGHFVVKDTGPGIAEADREKIFHPFERVGGKKANAANGTGLGLTISRALAELMGGDIQLRSTPGQGSEFRFSLMLPRLNNEHKPAVAEQLLAKGYTGARRSVLVIDDEQSQRKLIEDILSPLGFEVLKAESAYAGLATLSRQPVDLVLLDLNMPDINGWQAARSIREAGHTIPIIIVSANVRDLEVQNHANGYHDDYLVKPFAIHSLLEKIGHQLPLEWQYDVPQADIPEVVSDRKAIGRNQYSALRGMAEIGYLSGFTSKLNHIEADYAIPDTVVKEIRQLASQCQFQKIIQRLDELLTQES